MHLTAIYTKR